MKKIVIVGSGGFGREIKFLIDRINQITPTYELIGFFDDDLNAPKSVHGKPLLGTVQELIDTCKDISVAIAISLPAVKEGIVTKLSDNKTLRFPVLIDPSVLIGSDRVKIMEGTIICAGVIITCDITIKRFVTLNLSCTVGHDTIIDDFCSFMPTVNISGEVVIHNKVYVGTGAKIINQLEIGENTVVGAGAVVAKSLPANCTAVGIPAKPIKFHD